MTKMPAHPPVQESVMTKQVDIDMIDTALQLPPFTQQTFFQTKSNFERNNDVLDTHATKSKLAPEAFVSNQPKALATAGESLQLVATSALQKLDGNLENQRHLILRVATFCH